MHFFLAQSVNGKIYFFVGSRIEIREVAFNGELSAVVILPGSLWLFVSALAGFGFIKKTGHRGHWPNNAE